MYSVRKGRLRQFLGLMLNVPFYGLWPAFDFLAGDRLTLLPGHRRDALQKDEHRLLPPENCRTISNRQPNTPYVAVVGMVHSSIR